MDFWKNTHTRLWLWLPDAPKPEYLRDAVLVGVAITKPDLCNIVVEGLMPAAWSLVKVPGESWFELDHKECGNPTVYEAERIIMRFKDCRVHHIEIVEPQARSTKDSGLIAVLVTYRCVPEIRA